MDDRIVLSVEPDLPVDEFFGVLQASTLAERRPTDPARLDAMLRGADLIVCAREKDSGKLIGVARAVTDFSYCCYLSDLAVDSAWQGNGVAQALMAETRRAAGGDAVSLILLSAPGAVGFYEQIGMPRHADAFVYRGAK